MNKEKNQREKNIVVFDEELKREARTKIQKEMPKHKNIYIKKCLREELEK